MTDPKYEHVTRNPLPVVLVELTTDHELTVDVFDGGIRSVRVVSLDWTELTPESGVPSIGAEHHLTGVLGEALSAIEQLPPQKRIEPLTWISEWLDLNEPYPPDRVGDPDPIPVAERELWIGTIERVNRAMRRAQGRNA